MKALRGTSIYGQHEVILSLHDKEVKAREIILPLPPSDNEHLEVNWPVVNSWYKNSSKRAYGGKVLKNSTKYNRWIDFVASMLKKGKLPPLEDELFALITVVVSNKRRTDSANREKALFDGIQKSGCVYLDDSQVVGHQNMKTIVGGKNFVVVYILRVKDIKIHYALDQDYLNKISEQVEE